MTETTAPVSRPRDWAHAWSALKDLIADPERTDRVFEIIRALSGNAFEKSWQRFRCIPTDNGCWPRSPRCSRR